MVSLAVEGARRVTKDLRDIRSHRARGGHGSRGWLNCNDAVINSRHASRDRENANIGCGSGFGLNCSCGHNDGCHV